MLDWGEEKPGAEVGIWYTLGEVPEKMGLVCVDTNKNSGYPTLGRDFKEF